MKQVHKNDRAKRGLTLVELLVVVTILVMLVGVVLPLASPALKGREIREAARQVNAVFAAARMRAVVDGRSAGVALVPSASNSDQCFQLAFAKVPPPYTGDSATWRTGIDNATGTTPLTGTTANVLLSSQFVGLLSFTDLLPTEAFVNPEVLKKLVEPKPVVGMANVFAASFHIRFNYRGPYYQGVRVKDATSDEFYLALPTSAMPPGLVIDTMNNGGMPLGGLPFQIQRSPKRSAAAPVDLPVGAYIDLRASGFAGATLAANSGDAIYIMFAPDGSLDSVQTTGAQPSPALASLFLLIANGKIAGPVDTNGTAVSLTQLDNARAFPNLNALAGSLWVDVDHRLGRAKTSESLGYATQIVDAASLSVAIEEARQAARSSPSAGGR